MNDVEYIFIIVLATLLLWEVPVKYFVPFLKLGVSLVFLVLSCRSSLYILDMTPLSGMYFSEVFKNSLGKSVVKSKSQGFSPTSPPYVVCHLAQVISPLPASISSSFKRA